MIYLHKETSFVFDTSSVLIQIDYPYSNKLFTSKLLRLIRLMYG